MNFGLNDDQQMLRDTFARFLDENSSMARVRKAQESAGFDRELWQGLAELGTFSMRLCDAAGGLGMGTLDAALVMEEAGRTLASGPIAEALVAARLLGDLGADAGLIEAVTSGEKVATLAFRDVATLASVGFKHGRWLDSVLMQRALGCGDAIDAGYAVALVKGFDPETAVRFAQATSALNATGLGSQAGVESFEHTLNFMKTVKTRT